MSELTRKSGETDLGYHKRLVYGKLVDKTLADYDYSELAPYVYGKDYSTDVARRMFYGSCRTLKLLDGSKESDGVSENILSEIDSKIVEIKKERQKLSDERVALNKVIRERARQEELNEIITNTVSQLSLPSLPQTGYVPQRVITNSDNDILVSLNDIHYGANYKNYWGEYNSEICAQMLKKYLDKIIAIGKLHNSENCIVWENGDAISGNIHNSIAVTNKENVKQQIFGVSELIAQFLSALSLNFKKVSFISVSGNHSRIDTKERALKDERLDDLIEWYLAARLNTDKDIIIGDCEKIDETMYLLNIRGKTYVGVHGDYDFTPTKIHDLQTMAGKPLYGVLMGHLHHNKVDTIQGVKVIMSGSFLGMDDYCVSKRIVGRPEQLVCICDSSGIKCSYDIDLRL